MSRWVPSAKSFRSGLEQEVIPRLERETHVDPGWHRFMPASILMVPRSRLPEVLHGSVLHPGHRPGNHQHPRRGLRLQRARARQQRPRADAALPASRLGRARRRAKSGSAVAEVVPVALEAAAISAHDIAAIGLTNQRETDGPLGPRSGQPVARAIVWQDRRTADFCRERQADEEPDLADDRPGPRSLFLGHQNPLAAAAGRVAGGRGPRRAGWHAAPSIAS